MTKSVLAITVLFAIALVGVIALKWHDPSVDVTFISVLITMVMGFAGFIVVHFKQQATAEKIEKMPTKEDVHNEAQSVKASTESQIIKVTEKQTEQIKSAIEDK